MSSLLDVAKAMSSEGSSNSAALSLVDVAKSEDVAEKSTKPLTLMEVAKQGAQSGPVTRQTLQHLAQEIDNEDRAQIQVALVSTAKEVQTTRQELRSQTLTQTAAEMQLEEQAHDQVACVDSSKTKMANVETRKEIDDDDGYSSFEDDEIPKKHDNNKQEKPTTCDENNSVDDDQSYDPPPQTTPSESKESKDFLRAVYRADKYQILDMLDNGVVDANTADEHGWSSLHWAASQNHSEILKLVLTRGGQVNAIEHINGWTALHVAVVRESVACVHVLLSSGANPRIKDKYGDTVVECLAAASRKKKTKLLQLVQEVRNKLVN